LIAITGHNANVNGILICKSNLMLPKFVFGIQNFEDPVVSVLPPIFHQLLLVLSMPNDQNIQKLYSQDFWLSLLILKMPNDHNSQNFILQHS